MAKPISANATTPARRAAAVGSSNSRAARGGGHDRVPASSVAGPARSTRAWAVLGRTIGRRSAFPLALVGAVLLWAAQPPLNLWPLAWLAPVSWLWLVRRTELPGHRPYLAIALASGLYWLATIHGVRLPHWANYFGWVALSAYLACYLPAFVGLCRVAVHRLHIPLPIAAAVVWVGLELARAHVITGFAVAGLSHPQLAWLPLVQVADLGGQYLVELVVIWTAACLALAVPDPTVAGTTALDRVATTPAAAPGGDSNVDSPRARRLRVAPLLLAAVVLLPTLAYGYVRLAQESPQQGPKVALIQGAVIPEIKSDPAQRSEVFGLYFGLSREAVESHEDLDLIIWPETMFRDPLVTYTDDAVPPPGATWTREEMIDFARYSRERLADTARALGTPLLVGIDYHHHHGTRIDQYNSALHVAPDGTLLGRYDKRHLVLFGEYVPLGDALPWLYILTPLDGGLTPGTREDTFVVGSTRWAANICFETVLAHLIHGQVARLRGRGDEPQVLVNLTNDGWFRGSSILDLHLAASRLRAVEARKPLIVAANGGFSAVIDGSGRIHAQGARQAEQVLVAHVPLDERRSPYTRYGDLPAGFCLAATAVLAVLGGRDVLRRR